MPGPRQGVFIVEDDEPNAVLLRRMMERAGFPEVTTLRDPHQALAVLEESDPELLVVDLHLPGLDGLELVRRVHAGGRVAAPVILVTGDLVAPVAEQAAQAGVAAVLTKPFSFQEVVRAVESVLGDRPGPDPPPSDPPSPGTASGTGAEPASADVPDRVLVVDDDADARLAARRALERAGFAVGEAADGETALAAAAADSPALVLLDLLMPGMSGFEVLTELRRRSDVPVIVLSGRGEESERVLALEIGADDYVVKPFLVRELPARIRSVLRRTRPTGAVRDSASEIWSFEGLEVRPAEREVLVGGVVVETTAKEFDLLVRLASEPRRVFSRARLLEEVWGSSKEWQDPATVTEHVRRLRRKLEADPENPRWIRTVRSVGYRFEP